jgi:hypothetical protein
MPANAFKLLGDYNHISIGSGLIAWRVHIPRHRWGWLTAIVFAFGALYLFGHLLGLSAGPMLELFGFDVALPFDVLLALVDALAGATCHRLVPRDASPA